MESFKVLIGREHVEKPKPDAEPILKALEHFDLAKKEIWMIGDTKLDLIAAQNAKIEAIGVLSGYDTKEKLLEYTKYINSTALDAVKFLRSRKISHS